MLNNERVSLWVRVSSSAQTRIALNFARARRADRVHASAKSQQYAIFSFEKCLYINRQQYPRISDVSGATDVPYYII